MTSHSRKIAGCRGFSLLEVLVAFAILALSLGVLYQIFSSAAQRATLLQEYNRAVLLGETKLARIGVEEALVAGSRTGEFDERYRWTSLVEPVPTARRKDPQRVAMRPYRVTVKVDWGKRDQPRSVAFTTIRLGEPR
jgi:general secretion pathway protein I